MKDNVKHVNFSSFMSKLPIFLMSLEIFYSCCQSFKMTRLKQTLGLFFILFVYENQGYVPNSYFYGVRNPTVNAQNHSKWNIGIWMIRISCLFDLHCDKDVRWRCYRYFCKNSSRYLKINNHIAIEVVFCPFSILFKVYEI